MKLHEIAPIKRPEKSGETIQDYQYRLDKLGMKSAGGGIHSEVYEHPQYNTIVVKVGSEGKSGGPFAYLSYAYNHQDNPHVPKIFGVRRFKNKKGRNFFVAFIEKLTTYGKLSYKQQKAITRKYFGPVSSKIFGSQIWDEFFYGENFSLVVKQAKQTGVPNKKLLEVITFIHDYDAAHPSSIDLHEENIMMRGSVPVIIDPFV